MRGALHWLGGKEFSLLTIILGAALITLLGLAGRAPQPVPVPIRRK
jgi:hypothetical protein